jgi:hypothetical protein
MEENRYSNKSYASGAKKRLQQRKSFQKKLIVLKDKTTNVQT